MALILFAPNVHTGGGRVLLDALDETCADRVDQAIIDRRLAEVSSAFSKVASLLVCNRLTSRMHAEWHLWCSARRGDTVLCLHSLPPLFPVRAHVVVFLQNRLLLEHGRLEGATLKTRMRVTVERLWGRHLQKRCSRYLVQTPSMAAAVTSWLRLPVPVVVVPFAPSTPPVPEQADAQMKKRFDFVYVASGEAHKNHHYLLHAWRLLAEADLRPALALTIDQQLYPELAHEIGHHAEGLGLNIINLGMLTGSEVSRLYRASSALVFPSLCESFGLPLIEAAQHCLPIIASELDYVRDVIEPVETFDPESPVSIARAVRRFLKYPAPITPVGTAEEFFAEVLR